MPGANYMGGKRNAAKARVKDTTGRLEKTFFGQRRLCALSKGILASKPIQRDLEESLGRADISLGHARQNNPPNNNVISSSFIPKPKDLDPSTPRSCRRTKQRLEAHSSSSSVSRSKVLDALDVSEPTFLRGVLDRILTISDLAGISKNRTKPTAGTGRQPQFSDESSPLQQTKRKRSASKLSEESNILSIERPSSSSRQAQSYIYENVCTPLRKKYTIPDIADTERTRVFKNLLSEDSYYREDYNSELTGTDVDDIHDDGFSEIASVIHTDVRSNPWSSRDYRFPQYRTSPKRHSSYHTPCSNLDSSEIMDWDESYTHLPTCIVFRGLKDGSAKRSMATSSDEEPTVYGTLFEQVDPWDTIGQILGLSNTKPSKSPRGVEHEVDWSKESMETRSTAEWEGDLDIPELQHSLLIEKRSIGLQKNCITPGCDSLEEFDGLAEAENAISRSPQLFYLREDIAHVPEGDLWGDIEEEFFSLMPLSQEVLKSPGRMKPGVVLNQELDVLDCSGVCDEEYESVLAIPELEEVDGIFMGPSLFENEIW